MTPKAFWLAAALAIAAAAPASALTFTGVDLINDANASFVNNGTGTQVGSTTAADFTKSNLGSFGPFDLVIYRLPILAANPNRIGLQMQMTVSYTPVGTSDSDPAFGFSSVDGYRVLLRQDVGVMTIRSADTPNGPSDGVSSTNIITGLTGVPSLDIEGIFNFSASSATSVQASEGTATGSGTLPAFNPSQAMDFVITHNNNSAEIYRISSVTINFEETLAAPVPLPASLPLLAAGFMGAAFVARRKKAA